MDKRNLITSTTSDFLLELLFGWYKTWLIYSYWSQIPIEVLRKKGAKIMSKLS